MKKRCEDPPVAQASSLCGAGAWCREATGKMLVQPGREQG